MLVVLDACVLYPPSLRDLLLTLAALDAFDIRWSEAILEELRRNVVADNPQVDGARFSGHTLAEMRKHFPEAMFTVSQAEIDRLDNHPKDRHVAAVAVAASADAIVTINVRTFAAGYSKGRHQRDDTRAARRRRAGPSARARELCPATDYLSLDEPLTFDPRGRRAPSPPPDDGDGDGTRRAIAAQLPPVRTPSNTVCPSPLD